ncbi:coiled-coil domain-containing protein 96-like [Pectinophora gossypiella]|uniref:coiled-coil domain-containing protein 96-like n=1 Tax=Pectinophora gossypiella TaxID=13191 RepID=UPI00214F2C5E|nr:coiled-coil domain-containing protein 96-like [Pectinophora gossypiella]
MAESKAPVTTKKLKPEGEDKEGEGTDISSESTVSEKIEPENERGGEQIGKGVATRATVAIDRDEYLQSYRELKFDHGQLQIKNNVLHRRLSEYYKKRKLDHVLKAIEASIDLEEKYQSKLLSYEELKEMEEREVAEIKQKVSTVEVEYQAKLEIAEKKFDDLQEHERNTGSGLIFSKKGKPISDKAVARFLKLQRTKTRQTSAMMLRYIRVRNAVAEQEAIIRKLERIGPGLYVAQYEQLRIDKLNYTNKIEERDDELIKNRMKCTEHNQILAHIREKMHHTSEVTDITECDLGDAEIEYQRAREDLSQVKTRRDKLRWALEAERLKAGLLTKKDLLRDYQNAVDQLKKMKEKKERLEHQIAKTNMELREARRCIIAQPSKDEDYSDFS